LTLGIDPERSQRVAGRSSVDHDGVGIQAAIGGAIPGGGRGPRKDS
jgi:hypothetical protein